MALPLQMVTLLSDEVPKSILIPSQKLTYIPKIAMFKGSRYRLSKAHHFGALHVSFQGEYKSILLSIHTMSTSPLRQAACNGVVFVGGMALTVVFFGDFKGCHLIRSNCHGNLRLAIIPKKKPTPLGI